MEGAGKVKGFTAAKKSLLGKALARPDWVKQVIDKVKTEGLMEAWRQSKARLDMPVPLGYSSAGKVIKTDVTPVEHPGREPGSTGQGCHPGEMRCAVTSSISLGKEDRGQ